MKNIIVRYKDLNQNRKKWIKVRSVRELTKANPRVKIYSTFTEQHPHYQIHLKKVKED